MSRTRKKKNLSVVSSKGNGASDPSSEEEKSEVVTPKIPFNERFKLTGPEILDGEKHFSPEDLALYELAQYKLLNAIQAVKIKGNEADEYQRKANLYLAGLQQQKKNLEVEVEKKREALLLLQTAITSKYEVDLSKVTYDDETGRISAPPDAEGSQPDA